MSLVACVADKRRCCRGKFDIFVRIRGQVDWEDHSRSPVL